MPRGDGTGPAGLGPMTGRAAGYCAGYNVPGYLNPLVGGWGRPWGRGLGRGLGWRRFWAWGPYPLAYPPVAQPTKEEEVKVLSEEAAALEKQLQAIKERLAELEAETDKEK